jgi:hypothetical protein
LPQDDRSLRCAALPVLLLAGAVAIAGPSVDPDRDPLLAATTGAYGSPDRGADARSSFYATTGISTLGIGVEISRGLGRHFALRIGANGFDYGYDETTDGVDYAIDLQLRSAGAHLDWYPTGRGFFLSGGALYNGNGASVVGRGADGEIEIGDEVYDADLVGDLSGDIAFENLAPVAGAGWNTVFRSGRVGLHLFAGVAFQGAPSVSLAADGPLADEDEFQQELERERADLESDLETLQFYPVASLGLTLRF